VILNGLVFGFVMWVNNFGQCLQGYAVFEFVVVFLAASGCGDGNPLTSSGLSSTVGTQAKFFGLTSITGCAISP